MTENMHFIFIQRIYDATRVAADRADVIPYILAYQDYHLSKKSAYTL